MATNNDIREITKELHEINRKLDRLCQAYIFSVKRPTINVAIPNKESDSSRKEQTFL